MYIRRTTIKTKKGKEPYFTFRIVETERVGGKVKQSTLLNLGRYFDVPKENWQMLVARIEQLLSDQVPLFPIDLPENLENLAQIYYSQILARKGLNYDKVEKFEMVNLQNMALTKPRRVGIENVALHALKQLKFRNKLRELGFNRHQIAATIGNIVSRMAYPASELASYSWLQKTSALGELIGYNFELMGHDRLYQASDLLFKHKKAIESHLFEQEKTLFSFAETITLYDLTNTFFEGDAKNIEKAKRGRSKEKRTDRPLITLGLVLDVSGFPRASEIFSGNVSEPGTLEKMLNKLNASKGCTVVMDAGIATEENINWLKDKDFRYIAVSRKRKREFNESQAITVKEGANQLIQAQRVVNKDTGEVELYCKSASKCKKEQAMQDSFSNRFETMLQNLNDGLNKKGTLKRYEKIIERIGRLKEKYSMVAQHYDIQVKHSKESGNASYIHWSKIIKGQQSHPGVYCLRTDLDSWDENTLWHTYTMLTDLESVFRSLKSELGLRPIYHQNEKRVGGHLFITVLAYHFVHVIRSRLKARGIHDSWQTIRQKMENQQRITVSLKRQDGKTIHIRKSTLAEPHQQTIYDALGMQSKDGFNQRTVIS